MSQPSEEIWFNGPVVEAVSQATARNLLFVACIVTDASSGELSMLDKNYVKQILKTHCLCIKLVRGSSEEAMFSQLFPSTQTPSVYIVRSNADKVLLSGEDLSEQRIVAEIESMVSSAAAGPVQAREPAQTQEPSQTQAAQAPVQRQSPVPAHLQPIVPVQPQVPYLPVPQSKKQNSQDAAKLAEAKHMEEYRKRLAKEKRADAAYRKTILESIKQDREDFKAVHGTPTSASGSKDTAWRKQLADTTGKTKILFRISDGRVESGEFDVQAEFAEVRAFVEGIEGIPKGSLDIAEAFPRRMLGGDVDDKSLSDLGLVPTATLLVNVSARRVKDGEAFKEPVTWLAFFYSMLAAVFGFFGAFLPGRKSEDENQATYTREDGAVARSTARREEKSPDEKLTRRRNTSPGSEAGSDDDEKPKTYNGNSTNLE